MIPLVRFVCETCGDRIQPARTVSMIRGDFDRYAVRCRVCRQLHVGLLEEMAAVLLLNANVRVLGDADIADLIEPADLADLDDLPTKEIPE